MFQIQASGKNSAKRTRHKQKQIYRLAAIDLDGTLLNPDRRISEENKAAVAKLREANIEVVLASGRKHEDIYRFHQELELTTPILSCHGALVKDPQSGEVISNRFIPRPIVMHLLQEAIAAELSWVVYDPTGRSPLPLRILAVRICSSYLL